MMFATKSLQRDCQVARTLETMRPVKNFARISMIEIGTITLRQLVHQAAAYQKTNMDFALNVLGTQ
jgi:hypothetical protein